MGVRLQEEIHLLGANIFPGPRAAGLKSSLSKSCQLLEQLCRSFSELQQKGVWQEGASFIIFYFPSCGSVWTGLSTVTAADPRSIRGGKKENPVKGKVAEFLTGTFRGSLL